MDKKNPYLLSSVNNALKILDILSVRDNIGLAELSRLAKLDKTSVFKILYTLEHRDYVLKTSDARYRLGVKFTNYGNIVSDRHSLADVASPFMCKLRDLCHETICLGVLNTNGRVIVTHLEESDTPNHIAARIGYEMDSYNNANGKLLLAYLDETMRNSIIQQIQIIPRTPSTVTSKQSLIDEIAKLKGRPWVDQYEENYIGHSDIAAPIFDANARCIAAISIVCASETLKTNLDSYSEALIATAKDISRKMGYYE